MTFKLGLEGCGRSLSGMSKNAEWGEKGPGKLRNCKETRTGLCLSDAMPE